MAQICRDIMGGTRDLLSSLMDSRLNNVMERLTSVTLILSIPTVISGLYGMNVDLSWMPLAQVPRSFGIICGGTAIVCVVLSVILVLRRGLDVGAWAPLDAEARQDGGTLPSPVAAVATEHVAVGAHAVEPGLVVRLGAVRLGERVHQ